MKKKSPDGGTMFAIYEKESKKVLATLPTTIPIGATLEGFTRAGYNVGWTWA